MTKRIFRTNYFEFNFIPYLHFGIGYEKGEIFIGFLFFMLEIHLWMFKPKKKGNTLV